MDDDIIDLLTTKDQEQSRARRINGLVVGIITNNNDPQRLGRVKIYFPWLSDNNETDWTRIATIMGGKERGTFFLPEVDDEVLVGFENDDFDRPYVIGSVWSKEDSPPETNADGKNNIRKIRSRSGHEIIFDDSDGKELVNIHTNANHTILLDDNPGSAKVVISDKTGNNSIQIDSNQNSITISSLLNLKIKATNIEIEASGMMTIKAGATLTIKGALVTIN